MKGLVSKLFAGASFVALALLMYRLFATGLANAITQEAKRYSDINVNYLYLMVGFVVMSFFLGWAGAKLKVE